MASYELCFPPQVSEIPRLIDWAESCCGAEGVADQVSFRLALAIEEAATNVIGHAFAGIPPPHLITVRLDITPQLLVAEIIDNGRPFDPTVVPPPDLTLPVEQRMPGGLGIHLMRSMVDRLQYHRSDGKNRLRLEKAAG
jgi:anti-sigma regulatory factor (Ser/Thr protein kinase)